MKKCTSKTGRHTWQHVDGAFCTYSSVPLTEISKKAKLSNTTKVFRLNLTLTTDLDDEDCDGEFGAEYKDNFCVEIPSNLGNPE